MEMATCIPLTKENISQIMQQLFMARNWTGPVYKFGVPVRDTYKAVLHDKELTVNGRYGKGDVVTAFPGKCKSS